MTIPANAPLISRQAGGDEELVVLDRRTVYQGYLRIDRYRLRHRLHAGGHSEPIVREVLERGHVVAVLPLDPRRDQVILVEQFRPGAYAAGWYPWLLECVAGIIEADESAEDAAHRETREETGCVVERLELISRFITSPGASSETVALYCGQVDANITDSVHGLAAEHEDILARCVGVDQAIAWLDEGRIVNAKTVIALQWLARHYRSLKRRWMVSEGGLRDGDQAKE